MEVKRINDHDIVPVKKPNSELPIYGGELIPYAYWNIFDLGRKHSGKTEVVRHILLNCAYPGHTTVYIFAATVNHDQVWIKTVEALEKKGVCVITYTSIWENGGKGNYVRDWLDLKQLEEKQQKKIEEMPRNHNILVAAPCAPAPLVKKVKKPKYQYSEYIFIFDDVSRELRDPSFIEMLKIHRHFKASVLCSSQWYADMKKDGRGQVDIWILFPRIPDEVLEKIAKEAGTEFDELKKYYSFAADKGKHSFLYFNPVKDEYRRNFTDLLALTNS